MTKQELFDVLWLNDEWYMMGYARESLFKSMSKPKLLKRYKEWKNGKV